MGLSAAIAEARIAQQEGDSRRVLTIYKDLLKDHPDDIRLQETFGDLLREDGQLPAAAWTYRTIASHWEHHGYFLRAVALHKKLLMCDRDDRRTLRRLATLYQRLQLSEKALHCLMTLADLYAAGGDDENQLQVVRNGLVLRPEDVEVRLRLLRILERLERREEILEVLTAGMQIARQTMDVEAYTRLAPRYLRLRPDDKAVERRLQLLFEAERRRPGGNETGPLELVEETDVVEEAYEPIQNRPFSFTSEVLLESPSHPVALAIRARRMGDSIEALRLLGSGRADEYPYAAMFERSAALIDLGKYEEALPHLELLSILPVITMQDRELVWFYTALALDGMKEYERAQRWLERIETTSPGQLPEVAERLARYQQQANRPDRAVD